MKENLWLVALLCVVGSSPTVAQESLIDSLVAAHSYELRAEGGELSGDGMDFLMGALDGVQFFSLAESHNVREIPGITAMLFERLHKESGYNYLALENGPLIMQRVSNSPDGAGVDSIVELVNRYPQSLHFYSDQELEMMSRVTALSEGVELWGIDQVRGGIQLLDQLRDLSPSNEARSYIDSLMVEAREYMSQNGENDWMIRTTPAVVSRLK